MKESIRLPEDNEYMIRSLKEQKQHTEKQMEELFEYLSGEDQYGDQLRFFGNKYQERIKEFEALKMQNEELKRELAGIKMSQDFNNLRVFENEESNRVSMDRGRPEPLSKMTITQEASDSYRDRLQEIKKLKNEAKQSAKKEGEEYDELIAQLYKFFEKISTVRRLEDAAKPGELKDGEEATVTVPKRIYTRLVEIYSINMANMFAKEFQQQLTNKSKGKQDNLNPVDQAVSSNKAYYSDIIKDPDFEIGQFFKKLAQRFGFGNEWETYHTRNINDGINLKGKIDRILKKEESQSVQSKNEGKEKPQDADARLNETFLSKISQLINELDFSPKEREYWTSLNDQIRKGELFEMTKLSHIILQAYSDTNQVLVNNLSTLVTSLLKDCFAKMGGLFSKKFKNTHPVFEKVSQQLQKKTLRDRLGPSIDELAAEQIWRGAITCTRQKLSNMFKIVEEHLLFASTGQIYRVIGGRG